MQMSYTWKICIPMTSFGHFTRPSGPVIGTPGKTLMSLVFPRQSVPYVSPLAFKTRPFSFDRKFLTFILQIWFAPDISLVYGWGEFQGVSNLLTSILLTSAFPRPTLTTSVLRSHWEQYLSDVACRQLPPTPPVYLTSAPWTDLSNLSNCFKCWLILVTLGLQCFFSWYMG